MPARCLRKEQVQCMAQMFEVTRFMVAVQGWDPRSVLPTLKTQLQVGTHAMGQSVTALLEQHAHVDSMTRVYLTLSAMAVATRRAAAEAVRRASRRRARCALTARCS